MSSSRRGLTAPQPPDAKRGRADLKHLRAMTEAEIRRTAPPELANLPRVFWNDAKLVKPAGADRRRLALPAWRRSRRPAEGSRAPAAPFDESRPPSSPGDASNPLGLALRLAVGALSIHGDCCSSFASDNYYHI